MVSMPAGKRGSEGYRFRRWYHRVFDDLWFRALIGPAQTDNAVQGGDRVAREQWKRDLEARRRFSREQRERKRRAREARTDRG